MNFLRGERVALRPLEPEDLEPCLRWINDPEILQYVSRVHPMHREREREWLAGLGKSESDAVFGIALADGGRLVGSCGLHKIRLPNRSAELGILIGETEFQGQGLGAESVRLLCGYGFDWLGLHRIELRVYAYNRRAIRCYEKCGFRREGVLREGRFWAGRFHDVLLMGLLEHEHRGASGAAALADCALEHRG